MAEKIIQIIPVGAPCFANYYRQLPDQPKELKAIPVQLWALVEDDEGNRQVKGMTHIELYHKTFCEESEGFYMYSDIDTSLTLSK